MPRRNRQKWHRERRLAAEAAKAQRRERLRDLREARAERAAHADAVLQGEHRRGTPRSAAEDQERVSISNLLDLADVDVSVQRRVLRLQDAMWRISPGSTSSEDLPWLLLIARCPWVGTPETFTPPSRSVRRKREAMALHLLTAYPVPRFLVRALEIEPLAVARVPEEDEWAVRILSHVGRGESLRKLVGTRWLPAPLTRAMQHRFLSMRVDTTPILALRTAQVVGWGGRAPFARRLCRTRLQSLRGPDPEIGEGFWHRIIGWLADKPDAYMLETAVLDRILAWFEHRQRESLGQPLRLKGRTLATVLDASDRWWSETQRIEASKPFAPSGLAAFEEDGWSIVEIRSYEELAREGEIMHHCVASYERLIQRGKVSIWSLRLEGEREATIEVALGAGKVVQLKQVCNLAATAEQRAVARRWAERNRLTMSA
ncbi:MAG: PcfJ domain-containing protein [Myxococcota bacterium]